MPALRLGFTGSRHGISDVQASIFLAIFKFLDPLEFHHGDCVGADAQAHDIALKLFEGKGAGTIIIHPPSSGTKRAHCAEGPHVISLNTLYYTSRNRNIVDCSDVLVAVPRSSPALRSGTWSTVRYALKKSLQVLIIMPSGVVACANVSKGLFSILAKSIGVSDIDSVFKDHAYDRPYYGALPRPNRRFRW